jgi:hypothetical protein
MKPLHPRLAAVAAALGLRHRQHRQADRADAAAQHFAAAGAISPNPQGALLLSEVTGCYVEYVGKGPVEPVFQFNVGPTQRVPNIEQCIASLRTQPGVTAVQSAPAGSRN